MTDKSYAVQAKAAFTKEQLESAVGMLASASASYYSELKKHAVPDELAFVLVKEFHDKLMMSMPVAKAQG